MDKPAALPAPRPAPVRVLLADPHPVARVGARAVLGRAPDLRVVGEADGIAAALALAEDLAPDVVVTGSPGPGERAAAAALCAARPVVVLAGAEGAAPMARGLVLKGSPVERLVEAVRAVAAGGSYRDPGPGGVALDGREAEVVRDLARGYGNKEIAARLALSVKTVETYKTRALKKLGVRTRVALVAYAVGRGWFLGLSPLK